MVALMVAVRQSSLRELRVGVRMLLRVGVDCFYFSFDSLHRITHPLCRQAEKGCLMRFFYGFGFAFTFGFAFDSAFTRSQSASVCSTSFSFRIARR